jgi:EAL domain-containing protein (putative c-di-GMP-specific phosphodiesterase class I)
VAAQLENSQVSANLLEIEITESVLFQETGQSMQLLSGLEKLGVTIALDDFGSGYSSLSYLTYINLNKVKLDRAFCYKFLTEQHQETMKNLMALFHSMGLLIVAEGIESDEHCRALKNFNCDLVQGYIFSKPVAAEKAETMFKYKFPV